MKRSAPILGVWRSIGSSSIVWNPPFLEALARALFDRDATPEVVFVSAISRHAGVYSVSDPQNPLSCGAGSIAYRPAVAFDAVLSFDQEDELWNWPVGKVFARTCLLLGRRPAAAGSLSWDDHCAAESFKRLARAAVSASDVLYETDEDRDWLRGETGTNARLVRLPVPQVGSMEQGSGSAPARGDVVAVGLLAPWLDRFVLDRLIAIAALRFGDRKLLLYLNKDCAVRLVPREINATQQLIDLRIVERLEVRTEIDLTIIFERSHLDYSVRWELSRRPHVNASWFWFDAGVTDGNAPANAVPSALNRDIGKAIEAYRADLVHHHGLSALISRHMGIPPVPSLSHRLSAVRRVMEVAPALEQGLRHVIFASNAQAAAVAEALSGQPDLTATTVIVNVGEPFAADGSGGLTVRSLWALQCLVLAAARVTVQSGAPWSDELLSFARAAGRKSEACEDPFEGRDSWGQSANAGSLAFDQSRLPPYPSGLPRFLGLCQLSASGSVGTVQMNVARPPWSCEMTEEWQRTCREHLGWTQLGDLLVPEEPAVLLAGKEIWPILTGEKPLPPVSRYRWLSLLRDKRARSGRDAGDLARDGRNWRRAAEAYRLSLNAVPDQPGIWIQLGHMLKEAGELHEAERAYFEALVRSNHDSDLLFQLGHFMKRAGRNPEACFWYLAALIEDSSKTDVYHELSSLGFQEDASFRFALELMIDWGRTNIELRKFAR